MEKKRSISVTIIGTLLLIFGGLPILGAIIITVLAIVKDNNISLIWTFKNDSFLQTLHFYFICLMFIISGIGIIKLNNWARIIVMTLMSMNFIAAFIQLIMEIQNTNINTMDIFGAMVSLLISIGIVCFFARNKIKVQFK